MSSEIMDIAIKGGIIVSGQGLRKGDLFIKDGAIDSVEWGDSEKEAAKVIDASGKFVLPGIIDAHIHPFYSDKMDTLSASAVYGGITTVIPYIGAIKAWGQNATLLDSVKNFIEEWDNNSYVDFALHCSLCHDDMETLDEILPEIVKLGVNSFKAFMAYKKRGMQLDDIEILKCMDLVRDNKGRFAVHCENGTVLDYLSDRFTAEGKTAPEYFSSACPNIVEADAVFRFLSLATAAECPVYIPHVSAAESLEVIKLFKQWGAPQVFVETCTHYLTLTDEEAKKRGTLAKVGPTLRSEEDNEALWKAVDEGLIDVIASDHAGHLIEKKEPLDGNVFKAVSGLPGLETMFSVTYDEAINKGRITLPKLIECVCENPAKIFGIYPQKGVLQPGSDADVVVFDPTAANPIKAENLHSITDYTMYEGRECLGAPTLVMRRGNILLEDGKLIADQNNGRFIPRWNK